MDKRERKKNSFEEQTYEFARQWARGIGRREFLKYAGVSAGAAALGPYLSAGTRGRVPVAEAAGTPKRGGVIKIGRISDSDTLDPQKTTLLAAHEIMTQIYDPLIYLDAAGKVFPALAKSWEFSNDNKTVTFKLEQGVRFHDGSPFNAAVMKWTVERQLAKETASPTAWMLGPIESVQVIDEYTVAYNYKEPFVPLWVGLSYSYCAPISKTAVEKLGDDFGRNPVGTGPFRFVSWEPDKGITLKRYEDHRVASPYFRNRGAPYLDGAQFIVIPEDATRLSALRSGDIDMIAGSDAVPIDKIQALQRTKGIQVETAPQVGLVYAYINTTYGPLGDKRVRKAINFAVDKQKMIKLVLGGNAQPAYSPVASAYSSVYYADVRKIGYDYDLQKAKALMKEAGQEAGFKMDFLLLDGPIFRRIGEVVKEDLSKINIDVRLQSLPVAELFAKGPEKASGMYFFWYTYSDPDIVYQMLHSGESICWSFHENPELDRLIEKQRVEFDPEKRKRIFHRIQEIAVDEAYWLYLYEGKYIGAMRDYVHGVWFDPLGFIHLQDMWMDKA
ncbi:MAG: twin-arginine translocation signal domain-containing protein [Deltaproteobacteria bacterium]|nr:twin-arginine translocation signal domain-containing protein [Deltaproteobacteria bacterium]